MEKRLLTSAAAAMSLAFLPVTLASVSAEVATHAAGRDRQSPQMRDLRDYARGQNSTGFLVMRHGRTILEENWPAPQSAAFGNFVYGRTRDGQLLEDVASQQKSFVSVLVAIAMEKGLVDSMKPVSDYLGAGWTKASPEQEAAIRVIDVLTMSSGLNESFAYEVPAGTHFFYNTPVYAITKKILAAAAKAPLDQITRDWLTGPLGLKDTAWRQRPSALASVGNNSGLVTTPRDIAIFGQMILAGGQARDGRRVISTKSLARMFERSCCNPAYGRLWWLNGGDHAIGADSRPKAGPLIAAAPADLVAAFGYLDRRLYVVPSLDLVVVRTGDAAPDKDFDEQLWRRLMRVLRQQSR